MKLETIKALRTVGRKLWFVSLGGLLIEWASYFAIMKTRPQWFLHLWGGGMTWEMLAHVWGAALIHCKLALAIFLIVLIGLWLWEKQELRSSQ